MGQHFSQSYKRKNNQSSERLIEALTEFYEERKTFPLCITSRTYWRPEDKELCVKLGIPNVVTYIKRFGSYRLALELAAEKIGIKWKQRRAPGYKELYKHAPNYKKYDKDSIAELMNAVYEACGEYPTLNKGKNSHKNYHKRFAEYQLPTPKTIKRHFGGMLLMKEYAKAHNGIR